MRTSLERFAWRMWRGEAGWLGGFTRLLLLPLEGAWRLATQARNRRYDRSGGTSVEGLSVVSVGNLAVGGTGKTPMAAWVVEVLREAGADPGLLLRGYGDDEVRLHRRWSPELPVAVGADRVAGAQRLRAEGVDAAVLDDGFQHRRLARALDIVLLAAGDPLPGPLLPRGPYREPPESLRRADVIVVTRRREDPRRVEALLERLEGLDVMSGGTTLGCVRLTSQGLTSLDAFVEEGMVPGPIARSVIPTVEGEPVLAVTAIARPEAFLSDVSALTDGACELLAFPDHHEFRPEDARRIRSKAGSRPVYVTEKDAVKLARHAEVLGDVRVVGQVVVWERGEGEVRRRLEAAVGRAEERAS